MPFTLTIELVGLCLFVPDPESRALYVLVPATGPDHGVDPHAARLCFDAAYGRPGSTALDGYPALVPVEGKELRIDTGDALALGLPAQLVNVSPVVGQPLLPGSLTGPNPPEQLTARIVLRSGHLGDYAPGACWKYPVDTIRQHLANRVTWQMQVLEDDQLNLVFTSLAAPGSYPLPPLYPIDGRLDLQLYCTPRAELPPLPVEVPPPPAGSKAHHFAAYYELFQQPVAAEPLPIFVGVSCDPLIQGGSPYTCMAAQADPP